MSDELLAALNEALDYATEVFAHVTEDQRGWATPCPEFTVDELSGHLIGVAVLYGSVPGGSGDGAAAGPPDLTARRPADVFADAVAVSHAAWTPSLLGEVFQTPIGEMKGAALTTFMVVEVLAHAWDLAAATGQSIRPSDTLAETALRLAHLLGEDALRAPKRMGPAVPVPADAPAMDRFVGFIGRDPAFGPRASS